ncbi:MAG: hypothetical protein GY940_07405 [bacterium]|nr:hypothetical protein [bacterium]
MSLIQRENKVGMKKGTAWSTAVEPGAGNGLYVKAHTPPKGARKIITNEDEFGRGMASSGEVLEYEAQSGSMSLRCYWEGMEGIVASLMGIYNSALVGVGDGVKHTATLDTEMDSIFHTIAWDEGSEIKTVNSARIVSGTFSYQDGLNLDINYLGDKVQTQSGWTNWQNNVSYPSEGKGIFKLSNAVVKINDAGGAGLADGDKLYPSAIDIAITRGFEGLPVTAGNDTISEPVEKAAPMVEITLTFPKKETATAAYLAAFNNRTFKKMSILFQEDALPTDGALNYELQFEFPKLLVMEAPDFAQDTPIPTTIKLKALKAAAAPTGMTVTIPTVTIQNEAAALGGYPSS